MPLSREELRAGAFGFSLAGTITCSSCATHTQRVAGDALVHGGCSGFFLLPAVGFGAPISFDLTTLCDSCHQRLVTPAQN